MKITEILKMLGVDKLDESKQSEITTKLNDMIQLKISEGVLEKETEFKTKLTEAYEEKFETYKNDISEKFSDFVDGVLEEELTIPEKIKEFAKIGEKYQPIIEKFKVMIGYEEGSIDEDVKNIMKEAKDEIISKTNDNDKLVSENMKLNDNVKNLEAKIYISEKCDELTVPQKIKAMKLLEGITDKEEIDRKINIIIEDKDDKLEKEDKKIEKDNINEGEDLEDKPSLMKFWISNL